MSEAADFHRRHRYGFNGTIEQLVRALRFRAKTDCGSTVAVKDAAADILASNESELITLRARVAELEGALTDGINQVEYLHEKFGETGSGNGFIAQGKHSLGRNKQQGSAS